MALLTKLLSKMTGARPFDQDTAYLGGLMHDIGIMVFSYLIPEEYDEFLREISEENATLDFLEQMEFSIDHAELGAIFLEKSWQISGVISSSVRKHHTDFYASPKKPSPESLVYVANSMCNAHGLNNGIHAFNDLFEDKLLTKIGLKVESKEDIIQELNSSVVSIEAMLL